MKASGAVRKKFSLNDSNSKMIKPQAQKVASMSTFYHNLYPYLPSLSVTPTVMLTIMLKEIML